MGKESVTTLDDLPDELDELDPFLDETARITFDLISLGNVRSFRKCRKLKEIFFKNSRIVGNSRK